LPPGLAPGNACPNALPQMPRKIIYAEYILLQLNYSNLLFCGKQIAMAEASSAARKFLKIRLRLFFKNLKRPAFKLV
jgi:hypothetical protein